MEFLSKMKPLVDFASRRVSIMHAQRRYQLPTCVIGSSGKCEADVAAIKDADVASKHSDVA